MINHCGGKLAPCIYIPSGGFTLPGISVRYHYPKEHDLRTGSTWALEHSLTKRSSIH